MTPAPLVPAVAAAPTVPRTHVLVRAAGPPERLLRTLGGLLRSPRAEHTVTVAAPTAHPLRRRFQGRVRFVELDAAGDPLELVGCGPDDALLVLEEGCFLPPGWTERLAPHAARTAADLVAASTNHARGPSRLDPRTLPGAHRISPGGWSATAIGLAAQWPGVAEDVEEVSSPLLLVPRPRPRARRLAAWWASGLHAPLALRPDARIALARDVAVWREPRRGAPLLHAEAYDPREVRVAPGLGSAELHAWAEALFTADPPRPRAHAAAVEALCRRGEFREALRHASACLRTWPDHVGVRLWELVAVLRSGDLGRAQARLTALRDGYPLDARRKAHLFACTGEIWRGLGDADQAEQGLRTALELEPREPLALASLGFLRLEEGRFEDALGAFQASVRADPEHAGAWSGFGRALALAGDVESARQALGRALALQPGDREARRLLSRIVPADGTERRAAPPAPPAGVDSLAGVGA